MLIKVKIETGFREVRIFEVLTMKVSRNFLTGALITCSILFLTLLQGLWLHASYEKAFLDFDRHTTLLLRTAMDEIRDSVFTANLQPLNKDSVTDTLRVRPGGNPPDSLRRALVTMEKGVDSMTGDEVSSNIRVIISSSKDSLGQHIVRPLTSALSDIRLKGKGQNFVIRIDDDTLSLKQLRGKLTAALAENDIDLPFRLIETKEKRPRRFPIPGSPREDVEKKDRKVRADLFSGSFDFGPVAYNPLSVYTIHFDRELVYYLFGELTTEITFCIFLTIITCSAFFLIYKNFRRQQRLTEQKDEFINNVSHELKTPIATVSVALEALQNFGASRDPKLTQEYMEIAKAQIAHLSGITDKILKTSFLENSDRYRFTEVDTKAVAEEVLATFRIIGSDATFAFASKGDSFNMRGSRELIAGILTNLLENALKYSPVSPAIELTLEAMPAVLQIIVKDNGIGIAPEYREKIFEKFFRIPTGNIHDVKGFGLGLSYVASAVKIHHGTIDVRSNDTSGTTFIISMPRTNQ
jgi:two-component system, OmpR family, phosphate regulon sensor histidine kinase PhoR